MAFVEKKNLSGQAGGTAAFRLLASGISSSDESGSAAVRRKTLQATFGHGIPVERKRFTLVFFFHLHATVSPIKHFKTAQSLQIRLFLFFFPTVSRFAKPSGFTASDQTCWQPGRVGFTCWRARE